MYGMYMLYSLGRCISCRLLLLCYAVDLLTHLLHTSYHDMDKSIQEKSSRFFVFLDVNKAYDTTYINGLLYKLWFNHRVYGHAWRWCYEFPHGRRIRVINGSTRADWRHTTAG